MSTTIEELESERALRKKIEELYEYGKAFLASHGFNSITECIGTVNRLREDLGKANDSVEDYRKNCDTFQRRLEKALAQLEASETPFYEGMKTLREK